ncbi:hypothetical protein B0H14DRAFT_2608179 [Mycena olivaceomarginata]|nr:hypothetical protein B0H14DRAFT_2608179 [Mycena olivaceomarginata]
MSQLRHILSQLMQGFPHLRAHWGNALPSHSRVDRTYFGPPRGPPWVGPIIDVMFEEDVSKQKLMREGKPLPAREYSEDTSPYAPHWWPESVKILHREASPEEDRLKSDFRRIFLCQPVVHPDRAAQSDNFRHASRLLNTKLVHTLMSDQFLTAWVTIDNIHLWGTHNDPRNPGTGGWATAIGGWGVTGGWGTATGGWGGTGGWGTATGGLGGTGGWGTAMGGWGDGWGTASLVHRWFPCFYGYRRMGAVFRQARPAKWRERWRKRFAWLRRLERQCKWVSQDWVPAQKSIAADKNDDLRMSDALCNRRDSCHFGTNHPPTHFSSECLALSLPFSDPLGSEFNSISTSNGDYWVSATFTGADFSSQTLLPGAWSNTLYLGPREQPTPLKGLSMMVLHHHHVLSP